MALTAAWLAAAATPWVEGAPVEAPAQTAPGPLLVLDPQRGLLTLYLRGAILREIPVVDIEVGTLRSAKVAAVGELAEPWTGGRVEPPRTVARLPVVVSGDTEPVVEVPPSPEEIYPAPACFAIRFAARRGLEVSSAGAADGAAPCRGTTSGSRDRLRLRVTLDPLDAAELYRSIPSEIVLLWGGEKGAPPPPA